MKIAHRILTRVTLLSLTFATAALAGREPVAIFAAASLGDCFKDIAAAFERDNPGLCVDLNLAGSQFLRTQIEQGARAAGFASADLSHVTALADAGIVDAPVAFAGNSMAVITPSRDTRVRTVGDLAAPGVKIVLAAPGVPAGAYAEELLRRVAASGCCGTGFAGRVAANVVSRETDVRAVFAKVAIGEADAGVVYVTDARNAPEVRAVPLPDSVNVTTSYWFAIPKGASRSDAGRAFLEYLRGVKGQAVLARHGFQPVPVD